MLDVDNIVLVEDVVVDRDVVEVIDVEVVMVEVVDLDDEIVGTVEVNWSVVVEREVVVWPFDPTNIALVSTVRCTYEESITSAQ